ncbi:MAG TPA: glycoside hydrolase family 38 C-terminal domain-containing protein, partial [Pirellulales bacterium]|nr:glycoside hydrolase family 38 C-terminal domain-containing protein [Pirellulales bacterium]
MTDALEGLDGGAGGVDDELATDFLSLGFCRLQIELLTRQMRYSTNIDETHFQNEALAAARAAMAGDVETSRVHLAACFDTLYEARKHFYPVDVYLIDLTLVAATTLGQPLAEELSGQTATNLLLPAAVLQAIKSNEPATWSCLLSAIDRGAACVLGGESEELELPLLPLEQARRSLAAGVRQYEALLGRRPQVYGRRRAGLWPGLPQLLVKFAFQGALHFTLDDGRFPIGGHSKTRWEGLDTSVIDVLARVPCDAAKSQSFLSFSRSLADSMDTDHVATLAFAHWPRSASPWYALLRRIAQLTPALGKFTLLDDYFSHTDMPGRLSKFEPDQYRTPYLKQALADGQNNPISKFVQAHAGQAACAATQAIHALTALTTGKVNPANERSGPKPTEEPSSSTSHQPPAFPRLNEQLQAALARFADALPRPGSRGAPGYLVVNPLSFSRRIGLELPRLDYPPLAAGAVLCSSSAADRKFAVVEVPPMGFAWVGASGSPPAHSRAKPIARENVLRNEFFEVTISRTTGGIQSVYSFQQRGNQLSQQIAFRVPGPSSEGAWRDPDAEASYTTVRAQSVEVTVSCPTVGEVVSRGQLVAADGRAIADFQQTTRVWAHSRLIDIEIELDASEEPQADPWDSYYAARFAWPDDTADLWRGVSLARQKTDATRIEAPEYVEIESGGKISILCGGLPYHRRTM